eukprot:TRINITY_DN3510_c0_g2_i1.p1 TRINITY_DN3510_c0_g2~~TRINITY_DN3510_c0_g2_i1.p1  ORF type:complete len:291 (-),score=65.57 TRINITY_DN3510_c0_g2_i1:198-1070(-)
MEFDSNLRFILPPGTPGFQFNNDWEVQQNSSDDLSTIESISRLQEIFPELDTEVLHFYLSENGGDEERATEELLRSFYVTANLSAPVVDESANQSFSDFSGPLQHPLNPWSRKLKLSPTSTQTQRQTSTSTPKPKNSELGVKRTTPITIPTKTTPTSSPSSSPTEFTTVSKKKKKKEGKKRTPKTFEIDLHGFQVKESLELVSKILFRNQNQMINFSTSHNECNLQSGDSLVVITGVGKHSPGGVPRIRPALISFLEKHSTWLEWEETSPGAFQVVLLPSPRTSTTATAV